jgi:hypothetical protein
MFLFIVVVVRNALGLEGASVNILKEVFREGYRGHILHVDRIHMIFCISWWSWIVILEATPNA